MRALLRYRAWGIGEQSLLACIQETTSRKWRKAAHKRVDSMRRKLRRYDAMSPLDQVALLSLRSRKGRHSHMLQHRSSGDALPANLAK